jgi:hypothetical protein
VRGTHPTCYLEFLLGGKPFYGFKQALAMDHSEDANGLTSEFVDQAVTVEEAFAHI